ncbi:MAG TPA: N-acetylmuramoyl-L-alanine amidase [Nocardioides sp.]|uniref:N-acetylmuramoyl-L-alanine amidase n=1 Tax=Nocardioides sp. TaxID=35761 RepID=UPI002C067988|nr:N-acetylmuramoyl-L-alanine amidase [Nocardioides sp.]HTW17874.1 N-acetylmuramoyl-L-alanine amidase [Nocardioides sp.]
MPASKTRFVTACQQLLALGVVLAVLTPAASVVTLDVIHNDPAVSSSGPATAGLAAYTAASAEPSLVPTAPVEATVEEIPLTAPETSVVGRAKAAKAPALQARQRAAGAGRAALVSTPQDVTGYGTVGVTWGHGEQIPEEEISLEVRTLEAGAWSDWKPLTYHDEHAPDPGSAEALRARPGTDELIVGDVDQVQVQVTSETGTMPADMRLAVIDPGVAAGEELEKPAIDTGKDVAPSSAPEPSAAPDGEAADGAQDGLQLQAARFTPRPTIYSRAQWGADERLRDKSSLRYYEVHAGYVHHTVNANNYSRAEVPGILRSIYAYHTKSRGWSDVGYNFLVDRFGRIWEGRAGGVDRPVVGAHTLGYNDYSFAMSAIGNFDVVKPTAAMVQAYGALFAWKLSLHGVSAGSTRQQVGPKVFQAINGHRDAGSTACPGRYLYAQIPQIRALAAAAQQGWSGRELESNLARTPQPDLVVRRASDKQLMVWPISLNRGKVKMGTPRDSGRRVGRADTLLNAGDWNRDGFGDVIMRRKSGVLVLLLGDGKGRFPKAVRIGSGFKGVKLLAAVGDMTGDGYPDLMGQSGSTMKLWPGRGATALGAPYVASKAISARSQVGIGKWDADGAPDTLTRRGGKLISYSGNGPGGLTSARVVPGIKLGPYDWIIGISDVELTGHADVVVRGRKSGRIYLLPGSTTGVGAPIRLGAGGKAFDLAG